MSVNEVVVSGEADVSKLGSSFQRSVSEDRSASEVVDSREAHVVS